MRGLQGYARAPWAFWETSSARATSVGLKSVHSVPAATPVPSTQRKGRSNRKACLAAFGVGRVEDKMNSSLSRQRNSRGGKRADLGT